MAAPIQSASSMFANCISRSTALRSISIHQKRLLGTRTYTVRSISGRYADASSKNITKTASASSRATSDCSVVPLTALGRDQSLRSLSTFIPRSQHLNFKTKQEQFRGITGPGQTVPLLQSITNHRHGLFRGYRSRRVADGVEADGDGESRRVVGPSPAEQEDSAWTLRTSVENVYLSWIRNTYIMTVAGVTMYGQLIVPYAQEAGVVILLAGGVNMAAGTSLYVFSLMSRRRRMLMSRPMSLFLGGMSVMHAVLWLGAIMVYLGYVEEDPELEEELRREEEKMSAQQKQRLRALKRINDKYD